MRSRLVMAGVALALLLAALLVWKPWTGQLEGTVYFTACGGTEPKNPPPGYSNCNTVVAGGAVVTAAPTAGGAPTSATADANGHYELRLEAGEYNLWAATTTPYHFRGAPRVVAVTANSRAHVDVTVALYAA